MWLLGQHWRATATHGDLWRSLENKYCSTQRQGLCPLASPVKETLPLHQGLGDRLWCGDGICQLHCWQLYPALPGRCEPPREKRLLCTFGNQCGPFLSPLPAHPHPTLGTSEMYPARRGMCLVLLRHCTPTAGAIHSGLASRSHMASSPDSSNPATLSVGPISVPIRAGPQTLDFA